MERHLILSLLLLSFIVGAGCSGRREMAAHLSDIASYINDKPDSALAELRAIDTASFHSLRNKAQHSLLHAMALDKCYINVTSDSIIAPAARYYRHHGSADDRMKALLYQAKILKNRGELSESAILYSKAEEWAGEASDKHAIAVLYLSFSSLYNGVYNYDKQQEYIEKALNTLYGTGDPMYDRAFGQLAVPYMLRREWDTADSLFTHAIRSSEGHTQMMNYIISYYGRMKLIKDNPDPKGAIELFNLKIKEAGSTLKPEEAGAYAYASSLIGDEATAEAILQQLNGLSKKDRIKVLPWLFRISSWKGDYQLAYRYLSEVTINQENVVQETLKDSVTQAIQDHLKQSLEKERFQRIMIALLSAFLLLIATMLMLAITLRKRNLQHEMDSLLDIHESLKMEHEALMISSERRATDSRNRGREKIQRIQMQLQKERIESFRHRKVFDYVLWMNENQLLSDTNALKEFKEEMMSFYRIERNQEELEKELDNALDGMVSGLKKDLGISNPKDVHFLCLWLLDAKPIVVSEILGLNMNTVYIKRSRLKDSIENLGDKYSFLLD